MSNRPPKAIPERTPYIVVKADAPTKPIGKIYSRDYEVIQAKASELGGIATSVAFVCKRAGLTQAELLKGCKAIHAAKADKRKVSRG